jgi:LmbE family N-acetylglucosaminyl deacetylase
LFDILPGSIAGARRRLSRVKVMADWWATGSDFLVCRRPHFRLDGDALIFMASTRTHRRLSTAELDVWTAIAEPMPLSALRQRCGSEADQIVECLHRDELCEVMEMDFASDRRRVLVVEPHADDAVLSIGGTLWQRRRECNFTIATMASRSNFTSYYYLDRDYFAVDDVVRMRRAESLLFARMIGGSHVDVGLTDAALRYRDSDWTLDFYRRHRGSIAAAIARRATDGERRRWVAAAHRLLATPDFDEIWIPQGSPHGDHLLTAAACIDALVSNPALLAGRTLRLYQDVPYAARYPEYGAGVKAWMIRAGFGLAQELSPIDTVFAEKLRLISIYASQFKMHSMRADVEASARLAGNGVGNAELFWTLRQLPTALGDDDIALVPVASRGANARASAWLQRNSRCDRLRILLLVPTGRWAADFEMLRMAFPRARFEIFVAPSASAEVGELLAATPATDRLAIVHPVGAGSRAWGALALRLAVASPMPTLFHVGDRRSRQAAWLSYLWPLSDTLLLRSFDEFAAASDRSAA